MNPETTCTSTEIASCCRHCSIGQTDR